MEDAENRKDIQKEVLSLGYCCFAYLQEVLEQISQYKTLIRELQNAKVQPMCEIMSEDLWLVAACAPSAR